MFIQYYSGKKKKKNYISIIDTFLINDLSKVFHQLNIFNCFRLDFIMKVIQIDMKEGLNTFL